MAGDILGGGIGDAASGPESCCSGLALQPLRSSDLLTLPPSRQQGHAAGQLYLDSRWLASRLFCSHRALPLPSWACCCHRSLRSHRSARVGCEIKATEQMPRTADLCYGTRASLAGMLTHGDVGVPGSMWLTSTLVDFVQHKRRRLLSLIRLNRRQFKLSRHSYNQEKEA